MSKSEQLNKQRFEGAWRCWPPEYRTSVQCCVVCFHIRLRKVVIVMQARPSM